MDLAGLAALFHWVPAFVLVLARIGSVFFTAPVLGGPSIPVTARALLSTALALVLVRHAAPQPIPPDATWVLALVREVLVGACLGFTIDLIFQGVRMGGELINRHAGFSAAENFDPDSEIGNGPMGDVLSTMLILLFLGTDGHHLLLASLAQSYAVVPLGQGMLGGQAMEVVTRAVADSWNVALCLSFPVLTGVMMITVVEGVVARAVPQINLLQITFAVKIVVSVAVFSAGLPAAVAFLGSLLSGIPVLVTAMLAGFR